MVGTTAMMQEDILMGGYASLVGMSINFAVMFRLKFRFSNRVGLLACGSVLFVCTIICAYTTSVPVLVATCFVAGWFRMWATFVCNSTIQLWLTPVRDMAIFFCYVYLVVDGVIQLSGIATVYTAFYSQWEYMHWIMAGLLAFMMLLVLILVKRVKGGIQLPLLGIDWIGAGLWSIWRYKTMTAIAFAFAVIYLGYFYFLIYYGVEKEMLFLPLFCRGVASVILILISFSPIRPNAIFPKWRKIKKLLRREVSPC